MKGQRVAALFLGFDTSEVSPPGDRALANGPQPSAVTQVFPSELFARCVWSATDNRHGVCMVSLRGSIGGAGRVRDSQAFI